MKFLGIWVKSIEMSIEEDNPRKEIKLYFWKKIND